MLICPNPQIHPECGPKFYKKVSDNEHISLCLEVLQNKDISQSMHSRESWLVRYIDELARNLTKQLPTTDEDHRSKKFVKQLFELYCYTNVCFMEQMNMYRSLIKKTSNLKPSCQQTRNLTLAVHHTGTSVCCLHKYCLCNWKLAETETRL